MTWTTQKKDFLKSITLPKNPKVYWPSFFKQKIPHPHSAVTCLRHPKKILRSKKQCGLKKQSTKKRRAPLKMRAPNWAMVRKFVRIIYIPMTTMTVLMAWNLGIAAPPTSSDPAMLTFFLHQIVILSIRTTTSFSSIPTKRIRPGNRALSATLIPVHTYNLDHPDTHVILNQNSTHQPKTPRGRKHERGRERIGWVVVTQN